MLEIRWAVLRDSLKTLGMVEIISNVIIKSSKTIEDTKMVNKHMKRCPIWCAVGKNAKTMTKHYTLLRMAEIQATNSSKCCWRCETMETLLNSWGEMQNGTATLEDSPATELFGVYLPKGVENSHKNLHKDGNSHFINSCPKLYKPICPSVAEQINKLWYIQTTDI